MYKAFFDRREDSIEGLFTILNTKTHEKVFNRLQARSGQPNYTHTNWVKGKSPIPMGKHKLILKEPLQKDQWPGKAGIGEFWRISNTDNDRIILSGCGRYSRSDIGLHPENSFAGSAGCIVIVIDTEEQKKEWLRLSSFLEGLIGKYNHIPLEVL